MIQLVQPILLVIVMTFGMQPLAVTRVKQQGVDFVSVRYNVLVALQQDLPMGAHAHNGAMVVDQV